jgi:tripartite ATP-independent transporter DctM subunit
MDSTSFAGLMILILIVMIAMGIHINVALATASVLGVGLLAGKVSVALSILSTTAFEVLRDYIFAVIPMFILMGELIARSGAAKDLFVVVNRLLFFLPGRLAVATVIGNAVFAAVVGVSIASAATFSRIAYPQMRALNYDKTVALGCIAGSSSLGMLIPPSVLMIVWGVLTELSIGKLFLAGFLPGILLAFMYALYCVVLAMLKPHLFGVGKAALDSALEGGKRSEEQRLDAQTIVGTVGTLSLVVIVLGGIWTGLFTPTEASGIGALLALLLALIKGLKWDEIIDAISETGRTSAPLLFLLICAQMYSRLLAMGGVVNSMQEFIMGLGLTPFAIIAFMVLVWFILGMFIDSVSIILLTVPIFAPLAIKLGLDPIAFAIIGILAIEAGILTPPFGLAVYTVKACVPDRDVSLNQIFAGSAPYWIFLVAEAFIIYYFPIVATFLPKHF